jgi:magnesium-transporting ATPase (P-type)
LIFQIDEKICYSGSSQDEINLLEAARDSGIANLLQRDKDSITIELQTSSGKSKMEVYQVLKVFEFNSDRKMMSVVLQEKQSGKVFVFAKGSDMAMIKRVNN